MGRSHWTSIRTLLKLTAAGLLLLLAPFAWLPVVTAKLVVLLALDLPQLAVLYGITAMIGVVAIAGVPFMRNGWMRCSLVILFLCGFVANHIAVSVQGEPLSSHMLATLIQARHEIDHALGTYGADVVAAVCVGSILAPFLLARPEAGLALGSWFALVPASALLGTALFIGAFTGRVEEFPSPIAIPVQLYFAAREAEVYLGPRNPLTYDAPISPKIEKVILVVDESVRGDFLQLNNVRLDNTPFLVSAHSTLANFGIAVSYSNCSATARVALRSGARDSDFPDPDERILRQPTLWQYGRAAGYKTVFIDTWLPVRRMSSMLTYDELQYVDERTSVPLEPYWEVDDRVADALVDLVNAPGRALVFVEKIGLHTPYARNLPPSREGGPNHHIAVNRSLDASRLSTLKDYSFGIWWRVDRFFERLLPRIDRPGVLLIYTSDHGQALYEGGYDASNCSGSNAARGEGLVPLLVFSGDPEIRQTFRAAAERAFGRAMHSDIFPTLLWAMGFDPQRVQPSYPGGLLDVPMNRTRRFFVFSPFTTDMQWVTVD